MNFITFCLIRPVLGAISCIPYKVLYLFSDGFYILLYYVAGYRKKVVRSNLEKAFPFIAADERLVIEKKFYRHLCDLIVETIKLINISEKNIKERCPYSKEATNLFNSLYEADKNVIIAMGHYGNWEMAGVSMNRYFNYNVQVVYRPLKNKYFDQLIYKLRSRFGAVPIPMNSILKELFREKSKLSVTAFIADQSPSPNNAQWLTFMEQDTPVYTGVEKIAQKFNYPVVFASVRKIKRGFYETDVKLLAENPSALEPGEITRIFMQSLEEEIVQRPELWLWSHRRWKHQRKINREALAV